MEGVKKLSAELQAANNERHRLALLQNQSELNHPPERGPPPVIQHITEEQKMHIMGLASKKARPVNMNPKQFAYYISGHGSDNPNEKIRVPRGCIVIVKAKSGDTTFRENNTELFNILNRNVILNPNSNKVELSRILVNTSNFSNHNHSIAIYNTDDEINNFNFSLISMFPSKTPDSIQQSGIIKLSKDTIFPENILVYFNTRNAFFKQGRGYQLNKVNDKDIYEFFRYSNTYEYYFTSRHIEDILDAILFFLNNNLLSETTRLYDYKDAFERSFIKIFKKRGANIPDFYYFKVILTRFNISENSSISDVLEFISSNFMGISLSEIFKDVEDGILQPGVFYNLVCRATDNTDISSLKKVLNENGKEVILPPSQLRPENKDRIGEAEFQRRLVERNQAEAGNERMKRNFTLKNNISNIDVEDYVTKLMTFTKRIHNFFEMDLLLKGDRSIIRYVNDRPKLKTRIYNILKENKDIYFKIMEKYFPPSYFSKSSENTGSNAVSLNRSLPPPPVLPSSTSLSLEEASNANLEIDKLIQSIKDDIVIDISHINMKIAESILIELSSRIGVINKLLSKMFDKFIPLNIKPNQPTPAFETREYTALMNKNDQSRRFTYKKGRNGKWKRVPVPVNLSKRPPWRGGSQRITRKYGKN